MKSTSARNYFLSVLLCLFGAASVLAQQRKSEISLETNIPCEPAADYDVIKKGETKCLSGNITITYLTLQGGTLIISGQVRINNLSINKGTILVTETGSAILPALIFNGDVTLSNHGSVTYMGNVMLSNGNNHILNEGPDSRMNWGSSELNFASKKSTFVNNGTVDIGTLRLNSKNGKVMLGKNSLTNVVNLVNNYDNRVYVFDGTAKLTQTGYAQLSKSLTTSAGLIICPGPASEMKTVSGKTSGYGNASVMQKGCTSFPALTSY